MKWIQVTHTTGTDLINVEQTYRIVTASTANILFYTTGSTSPTTLTFASVIERNEIFEKFQKILDPININRITAQ
jgi:hypothetical protein